jgi:hypothetical protein
MYFFFIDIFIIIILLFFWVFYYINEGNLYFIGEDSKLFNGHLVKYIERSYDKLEIKYKIVKK